MTTVGSIIDPTLAQAKALSTPRQPPSAPPPPAPRPPGSESLNGVGRPALRESPAHRALQENLRAQGRSRGTTSRGGASSKGSATTSDPTGFDKARFALQRARWSLEDGAKTLGLSADVQARLARSMAATGSLSDVRPERLAAAADGCKMLSELKQAVAKNPSISASDRNAFVDAWIGLRAKGNGGHHAWTRLADTPAFWTRLNASQRNIIARQLPALMADLTLQRNNQPLPTAEKVDVFPSILNHHLFGSATAKGRNSALNDWRGAFRSATAVNQFPTQKTVDESALHWRQEYLGKMKPASAEVTHNLVMSNLHFIRTRFFEEIPGSNPKRTWGQAYNDSLGNDYYKTMLSFLERARQTSACRSAYSMNGVHKGADAVCGTSY